MVSWVQNVDTPVPVPKAFQPVPKGGFMGKLSDRELLSLRESGMSAREIAARDGTTHSSILRRLKRLDKAAAGPQTADSLKKVIISDLDLEKLSTAQKLSVLRTLSKNRRRGVKGDLDVECEKYVAAVAGKTFTRGASPITEEAARKFFMEVMTGTWVLPDLSRYRLPDPGK